MTTGIAAAILGIALMGAAPAWAADPDTSTDTSVSTSVNADATADPIAVEASDANSNAGDPGPSAGANATVSADASVTANATLNADANTTAAGTSAAANADVNSDASGTIDECESGMTRWLSVYADLVENPPGTPAGSYTVLLRWDTPLPPEVESLEISMTDFAGETLPPTASEYAITFASAHLVSGYYTATVTGLCANGHPTVSGSVEFRDPEPGTGAESTAMTAAAANGTEVGATAATANADVDASGSATAATEGESAAAGTAASTAADASPNPGQSAAPSAPGPQPTAGLAVTGGDPSAALFAAGTLLLTAGAALALGFRPSGR